MTDNESKRGSGLAGQLAVVIASAALGGVVSFWAARVEFREARERDAVAHERALALVRTEMEGAKSLAEMQEAHERERLEATLRIEQDAREERLLSREAEERRTNRESCFASARSAWTRRIAAEESIFATYRKLRQSQSELATQLRVLFQGIGDEGGTSSYSAKEFFGETRPFGRLMSDIRAEADELAARIAFDAMEHSSERTRKSRTVLTGLLSVPENIAATPSFGMMAFAPAPSPKSDNSTIAPKLMPNFDVSNAHMNGTIVALVAYLSDARGDARKEIDECSSNE